MQVVLSGSSELLVGWRRFRWDKNNCQTEMILVTRFTFTGWARLSTKVQPNITQPNPGPPLLTVAGCGWARFPSHPHRLLLARPWRCYCNQVSKLVTLRYFWPFLHVCQSLSSLTSWCIFVLWSDYVNKSGYLYPAWIFEGGKLLSHIHIY